MIRDASTLALAHTGDSLGELTDEQRLRMTDVLDRYLFALEHGTPLAQDELLRQHPDLASSLANYFQSLEDLHDMAAGFGGEDVASEATEDLAGVTRKIGDFEIIRELGRGGMGVVYEANQISLARRVALKILPFAAVLDARQIARFQHEAQAAAQLHHPHIVPVFAIGVERGVHYYAMQLVNGQSLEELISSRRAERTARKRSRRGPEEFQTIARLGQQAAEALQAAHEFGIVHRDIKPSNLLLDAAGKLWVTDFGLARMQREVSLTRSGDLVGTLRYMSPEQASGQAGVVDERTDIYSLGATLYELATLRPAYGDENSAALLRAIETSDPLSPRKIQPDIPLDLENIIRRAMARERFERYATASELAADLQRFLAGQPTKARAATLSERVTRWSQRRARGLMLAASILLLLVVGLSISTLLIARAQHQSRKQLARADQYARDAREVLDRFGMQLSQRLASVAGAESVRRDLLLEASAYYRRFIADSKDDPLLRNELAVALGRLASLLDEVGTAEEALAAHQRAVAYLSSQSAAGNGNVEQTRQLSIARNNLALAYRRAGRLTDAQAELTQAKSAQQELHAREAKDPELARELATTYVNLGLVLQDSGNFSGAKDSFHSAITCFTSTLTTQPETTSAPRPLAAAYIHLAGIHKVREPELAASLHQQAIELLEAAATSAPNERSVWQELATTQHSLGTLRTRLQQYSSALAAFDRATALQRQLIEQFPGDAQLHSDLASSLSNAGVAHAASGDLAAASKSLETAIEHQQLALNLAPASERIRELLAKHHNLHATYSQQRDSQTVSAKATQLPRMD